MCSNERCCCPPNQHRHRPTHEQFSQVLSTFQTVRHFDLRSFDTIRRIPNRFNECECRPGLGGGFQGIRPPIFNSNSPRGFGFGGPSAFGFDGSGGFNRFDFDDCPDDDLDYVWLR